MSKRDAEFIAWLEGHEAWYEKWSGWWGKLLIACRLFMLSASITSIVVAAASSKEFFADYGKWLIIGAAVLTAIATEMLGQLKVREMEELREDGNIEASAIVAYAHQKFEEFADNPAKINKLKDELRGRIATLEKNQHRRHVAITTRACLQLSRMIAQAS